MRNALSVIILTKNSEDTLIQCLESVKKMSNDIIIVDSNSTDNTLEIAKQYHAAIFNKPSENLAIKRQFGIGKASGNWIFILDSDEVIPNLLAKEIKESMRKKYDSYFLPYQNHLFGKKISRGGENYAVLRLFRKNKVKVIKTLLHEKFIPLNKNYSTLKHKIMHYSYRSPLQVIKKFTNYAIRSAKDKASSGERVSAKKLLLYPAHMFWARFIKDKGYKDGLSRIFLDAAFAYMEFLTYFLLLLRTI